MADFHHSQYRYFYPKCYGNPGIRREARARPSARKAAITARELAAMIAAAEGEGTRPIRDRVILALGLAAALRRSEWSTRGLN